MTAVDGDEVTSKFTKKYPNDDIKDEQITTAVSLMNGDTTFLLAGTGFGKSRVPELFFHMFSKAKKPVILVLNPLDSLGDNQVLEKHAVGITAVNLTKNTFNKDVLRNLKQHYYSFIYLSPEIFLNSEEFQKLYHSRQFQRHLVLKVVDEAHCIYLWGLQESGESRNFSIHVTPQDVGLFRPAYGNLGRDLMATANVPCLFMSATCRPQAIASIQRSLRITPAHMTMIRAELVRPELRYIRIYLSSTLDSAEDLKVIIPPASRVSNDEMAPMLIYSGTRNATSTVSKVVCEARGTPDDARDGNSRCIRKYHSAIGEKDKLVRAQEFGEGKFPLFSCTSALGLGQNWKRVKTVVIMGAMDPSESNQMGGRAGRGKDEPGLVIIFVQPTMPGCANSLDEIDVSDHMNNEERMNAFRLTPCCLRVVYALDNLKGYIPMSKSNPGYLAEIEREKSIGLPACRCSTCEPQAAARIIRLLPYTKSTDLATLLSSSPTLREDITAFQQTKTAVKRKATAGIPIVCKKDDPIRLNPDMIDLAVSLTESFAAMFTRAHPAGCHMQPTTLFKREDAWQIVKNYAAVLNSVFLREILGGERIPGQFDSINECIKKWVRSDSFKEHQEELEDIQIKNDQEILDLELIEEEHREQSRLKVAEKALKDAGIAERKRLREEKAVEAERLKEEKRDRRQKELALREEDALEKAQLKAAAKAIKDAEKAVKDAGIAERKRLREEKKMVPPSVQG